MKYYTIYKITNHINNKIYIGKHETHNLDDGYMGSGKLLIKAIKKHNISNFTKEILFVFDNELEMNNKEAELVSEEFIKKDTNYNLCIGGKGGFSFINENKLNVYGKNGQEGFGAENLINGAELKEKLIKNNQWENYKNKISVSLKKKYESGKLVPGFKNKAHSLETKKKIGKSSSIHQCGSKNSQYGTFWVSNIKLRKNLKLKKGQIIPRGYSKGKNNWNKVERKNKRLKNKESIKEKRLKKNIEKAHKYYLLFCESDYNSLREFANSDLYPYSHVSLRNLWFKYLPEYKNVIQGKSIKDSFSD